MIKLTYTPDSSTGAMAWVGKGIMYDSGGISLKPADGIHAAMKNDMSGAGALLAAMLTLPALGCHTSVTGYLMCTDNMPSGSALKMGDVLTARNGTTVEVANTDAEGRLVMMDALVMAVEQKPDAIIDIATLTGASMRALGTLVAGVMGNDQRVIDQVLDAARATDERAWQLPLERSDRPRLTATSPTSPTLVDQTRERSPRDSSSRSLSTASAGSPRHRRHRAGRSGRRLAAARLHGVRGPSARRAPRSPSPG